MAIVADPAGAAQDQDGLRRAGDRSRDVEPVEHRFPGGNRGQGQRRRGGEIERARLLAHDPLVDEMIFHIGALPADAAGVEDFVARFEVATSGPASATTPAAS